MSLSDEYLEGLVRRAASVRDEELDAASEAEASRALFEEIVGTVPSSAEPGGSRSMRRSPRHRIGRRVAVIAVAAATAIAATTLTVGGRSTIEVRAADAVANPAKVSRQLRAQGIQADVLVVPGSLPGTWWHLFFAPEAEVDELTWARLQAQVGTRVSGLPNEEIVDGGVSIRHSETLELPKGLRGPLTIVAARAPAPGEKVAGSPHTNELAPTGAFWCLGLERMAPEDAGRALEELGYDVLWFWGTESEVGEPPKGSAIVWAWFRTPKLVDVRLAPVRVADAHRKDPDTQTSNDPPAWAPHCDGPRDGGP